MTKGPRGFTLIEVAIVVIVLTLLLGGLLIPLAAQVDQRRYAETDKTLAEIKDALIGFAQTNGRLPCPSQAGGNGVAPLDCDGRYEGDLPWATLNVPMGDAWGRRFRYRVSKPLVIKQLIYPTSFNPDDGIIIFANSKLPTNVLARDVSAIVISHGKNGFGTAGLAPPPAATDEAKNTDSVANNRPSESDRTFVVRARTTGGAGCSDTAAGAPFCEFDDAAVWISPFVLFYRMSQAGHFITN